MVERTELAVRRYGDHLVATTTSPLTLPAALSAVASARSEAPWPYISAVSNQLMPPVNEAATISLTARCEMASQYLPARPSPAENCQQPNPTAVTSMSVLPSLRRLAISASSIWARTGPFPRASHRSSFAEAQVAVQIRFQIRCGGLDPARTDRRVDVRPAACTSRSCHVSGVVPKSRDASHHYQQNRPRVDSCDRHHLRPGDGGRLLPPL